MLRARVAEAPVQPVSVTPRRLFRLLTDFRHLARDQFQVGRLRRALLRVQPFPDEEAVRLPKHPACRMPA